MTHYPRPSYRKAVEFIAKHDPEIKPKDWLNIDLQAGTILVQFASELFKLDPLDIASSIVRACKLGRFV